METFPRCWTALRKVCENHDGLCCAMLRPGSSTSSYKTPIVRADEQRSGACCQAEHMKAICFGCWGLAGLLAANVEKRRNRLSKWRRSSCVVVHQIAIVAFMYRKLPFCLHVRNGDPPHTHAHTHTTATVDGSRL